MFSWFIVTVWFELNNELHMEHYSDFTHNVCKSAISEIASDFDEKYPNRTIRAAKCNDPVTWFKKYKLDKWDQVKDKE